MSHIEDMNNKLNKLLDIPHWDELRFHLNKKFPNNSKLYFYHPPVDQLLIDKEILANYYKELILSIDLKNHNKKNLLKEKPLNEKNYLVYLTKEEIEKVILSLLPEIIEILSSYLNIDKENDFEKTFKKLTSKGIL